jgi:hypothetical protein
MDNEAILVEKLAEYTTETKTITGANYLRLSRFATELGMTDAEFKKIISEKNGIRIESNRPPEEPPFAIRMM